MLRRLQWAPKTIRGQITIVILLALLTVIVLGRALERWAKDDYLVPDLERIAERADTMALLMRHASPAERETLITHAEEAGWRVSLAPPSKANAFTTSSTDILGRAIEWLFPPDSPPPIGGWRTYLDGERVIAVKVDARTILILSGFPDSILTSSVLGQGSYYFVALVVLILFFFIFAIRTITEPIKRISEAAAEADIKDRGAIFAERGTVEIVALAHALNGMRNRISIMADARTRMLRGIGHDLRTPLTRLRVRAERMEEGALRESLLSDVDHIDRLIAESLNYLRNEFANEDVERVDVASILQTVCNDFADIGHSVSYSGPAKFVAACRPLSLTRAVTNLCDNGVKFAETVEVRLESCGNGFAISVADDGPGIPPALRERVFEPFFKCDPSRTDGNSGFGLGLSIVQDIAHSHRGRLKLLSRAPHGLIARIEIPGS
ncbi:ATP-binding protein [Methyloligella sp. 2.7D]|uniref:sensor histidine kinase n=1 Tax=unclassified Methyloligella TaxID=2625955 RepID=UPI00157E0BE1|nr:ATP-binding protein [Methyloligella sp. GL2]QKP76648.1 HAMP domain-containing protein [Methyloligella sp. GL2]